MNKYLTVSTEYLEDKIIGGKLNARQGIWLVTNMMLFSFINLSIENLLIIFIILLPINVLLYFVLEKKYKKSYLELYMMRKIKKVNNVVIHKCNNEDEWESNDDRITTVNETKISM